MVNDDRLKPAPRQRLFEYKFEQPNHRNSLFLSYTRSGHLLRARGVMGFRWLVQDEKTGHRSIALLKPAVQRNMSDYVAANPVISTTHILQFYGPVRRVCYDCQALKI